jgi:hypothetical protein
MKIRHIDQRKTDSQLEFLATAWTSALLRGGIVDVLGAIEPVEDPTASYASTRRAKVVPPQSAHRLWAMRSTG